MMLEVLDNQKYAAYVYLKELFAIALTQIISTSVAESGFSVAGAVKNEHTNALADPTLDDILALRFNGPPEMSVCIHMHVCVCVLCFQPACRWRACVFCAILNSLPFFYLSPVAS
jgi:hypothetical protein